MYKQIFSKSPIACGIALALGAGNLSTLAVADGDLETAGSMDEIVVTGIRASLMASVDRKRDSFGVVDAITAEDIGKFPDTNLAESLQRITGVSIDRSNGEGSRITVRGMGPEFNLVTLNGRQMPTTGGRSFDFADIASESVSAVEIYKTAKASLPTGGIGATVNMETTKPLNAPGFRASVGAKGVHETSIGKGLGDDFTPEIAGLFSNTFAEDRVGILISGAVQERNNREESAAVDNWIPNVTLPTASVENNNLREDGATWYPQNTGYSVADIERKRSNGQMVLQFAPTDALTATLDYTYSKVEFEKNFNAFGIWFNNGASTTAATVNERGTYTYVEEAANDYATNIGRDQTQRENKSLGLNLAWQATDNLSLEFDYHDSSAEDKGVGLGRDAFLIIGNTSCGWCADVPELFGEGTADIYRKSATFNSSGIPIYDMNFTRDGGATTFDELATSDIGSLFGGVSDGIDQNDMTQFQLHGVWENEDGGAVLKNIRFGAARTEQDFSSRSAYSGLKPAGWWLWSAQYWDDNTFVRESTDGLLDDFSNSGDRPVDYYYSADFDTVLDVYETIEDKVDAPCCYWPGWGEDYVVTDEQGNPVRGRLWSGPLSTAAQVSEVVDSVYTQFDFEGEFNGLMFSAVAGLRYEEAEVTSTGYDTPATNIVWIGGNEFIYEETPEPAFSSGSGTTKQFLPSLDFRLDVTDSLVSRFSYSRSLARPPIAELRSTTDFPGSPKIGQRKIVTGDPALKPYIADNFDLSLEYYYDDNGSYVSAGYFTKIVDNFLVSTTSRENYGDIRDVYNGPRAEQARAELIAEGIQATDVNVFARINDNLGAAENTPVQPDASDPLAVFDVTRLSNAETGNLRGFEFAVQHMLGRSGWGLAANATLVSGDVNADRDVVGTQFALPGMSDSANLSVFYENDLLSARVAYNWRDEFLSGFDQHSSPVFTEEYSQLDANVSFSVTENVDVFVEGLNLTDEVQRSYVRYPDQLLRANQYGARFNIGVRATF